MRRRCYFVMLMETNDEAAMIGVLLVNVIQVVLGAV
jgi:hypothetical protein